MQVATVPDTILDIDDRRARRQRARNEAWRRRSRLIRRLRRILPATIVAIILALMAWVTIKELFGGFSDGHSGAAIHMTNARFQGRDGDGHPYMMGAAEVARDSADSGKMYLTKPMLTYNMDSLKPTKIVSDTGLFRADTHLLALKGHVVATDAQGDTFLTSTALIDTQNLDVNGWNKVRGFGPHGTITADSFGIYNHGQSIVFSGDVHSILKRR